ncbi:MAG TPA: hypothetical protein VK660_10425 [Xanthomonadaceae bacterium]|jgi:hypothetical protein|nr:hypothetical protein [Xanthomonadaceae bacterium]
METLAFMIIPGVEETGGGVAVADVGFVATAAIDSAGVAAASVAALIVFMMESLVCSEPSMGALDGWNALGWLFLSAPPWPEGGEEEGQRSRSLEQRFAIAIRMLGMTSLGAVSDRTRTGNTAIDPLNSSKRRDATDKDPDVSRPDREEFRPGRDKFRRHCHVLGLVVTFSLLVARNPYLIPRQPVSVATRPSLVTRNPGLVRTDLVWICRGQVWFLRDRY